MEVKVRRRSGNLMVRGKMMTMAPVKRRRRKSILLARKGDPSSSTTPRASVAKRLRLLGSRQNALRRLLQRRLKKRRSIRGQSHPSR